ncbi:MAG: addiction module protein [Candidatus Brocadiae bacterium]|nr:addiction module protein [Candidatus Brocadiia bacterium]
MRFAANEKEAARRLKEADDGKASLIPWSQARKMAFGRKRRR